MISSLRPLFLESPLLGIALFVVVFALFVIAFCWSNPGRFLLGMVGLAASVFVGPVRYLQAAAYRVMEYSRPRLDYRSDRQYLIRTLLLMSNTAILLVAIAILASGGAAAWWTFFPSTISEQRAQARTALVETEKRIASEEKDSAELKVKLGGEIPEEKQLEDLNRRLAEARGSMARSRASLDAGANQTWTVVSQHLDQNDRASAEYEVSRISDNVTMYVERNLTPEAGAPILAYLRSWVETKRLQREVTSVERNNPRAALLRQKARLDEALASDKRAADEIRQRLSLWWALRQLHPIAAVFALLGSVLSALIFVWLAGVAVEWLGLFVDAATNIRMLREAGEARQVPLPSAAARFEDVGAGPR